MAQAEALPFAPSDPKEPLCYPEAALAGTLALMTCHAQCEQTQGRDELARHVVRNLSKLSEHPLLSAHFKSALQGLHLRWQIQLQNQAELARFVGCEDDTLWMHSPRHVQ